MIGGFEIPTSGEIFLNGKDISKLPPNKRPVNTVFQKYALFPYLNIYENIAFGLKLKKIPRQEIQEKVKRVLEIVDLEGFEKRKVTTLSGGQQQRVAIARAIAQAPPIILADEPTGNLDSGSSKEIMEILKSLHEEGRTVILITHDNEIAKQAKRIIKIIDGQIVQDSGKEPGEVVEES